ncbi:hypothetical protein N4T77_15840 [Clostridium sp. CX1]|uniref:Uncharacterized protein n=1 Tax=Clostridium tanneri TaxID=3037988 RepID=A0ABU4JRZ6_9CLOT|nr:MULTISPECIES: hypothetical protein [unclassified Clostridium]MCT8978062.1 hypothetical protein [Clostridium sp. CX1]MDW8800914.1 hypothetical protein [Clostridium sp. A1-XYC3]
MMDLTGIGGCQGHQGHNTQGPCEQRGTLICIEIPPGTIIRLANLLEISSPRGISLVIRIPLLGGNSSSAALDSIVNSLKQAGGTIEFVKGC